MTPIKVNWFVPTRRRSYNRVSASVWIRCFQLLHYLKAKGIESTVNKPSNDSDINVFVRWQNEEALTLAKEQKAKGRRVVFDLCVNYFDESGFLDGDYGVTAHQIGECLRMVEVADAVTCASRFIADRAAVFHGTVAYIPDSVDKKHFRFQKPLEDFQNHLRAIWSGVSVKAPELNPLLPILEGYNVPLIIIADKMPKIDYPVKFIKWSYRSFPKNILKGELCISPRRMDSPYNQGHSFFKIGVFMAQGVPVLASPVPSYKEVINNDNGIICTRQSGWEEAIGEIINDRLPLCKWSKNVIKSMEPYTTEQISNRYTALFNSLLDK